MGISIDRNGLKKRGNSGKRQTDEEKRLARLRKGVGRGGEW
jgi:hypothetical protein